MHDGSNHRLPQLILSTTNLFLELCEQMSYMKIGIIKYKENNRIEEVSLTQDDENILLKYVEEIERICSMDKPQPVKKIKYCRNCSYNELCFS